MLAPGAGVAVPNGYFPSHKTEDHLSNGGVGCSRAPKIRLKRDVAYVKRMQTRKPQLFKNLPATTLGGGAYWDHQLAARVPDPHGKPWGEKIGTFKAVRNSAFAETLHCN